MDTYTYREHYSNIEHEISSNDTNFIRYCLTKLIDNNNIHSIRKSNFNYMVFFLSISVILFGYSFIEMLCNLSSGYDALAQAKSALHQLPGKIAGTGLFGILLFCIIGFSLMNKAFKSNGFLILMLVAVCLTSMGLLMPAVWFVSNYPLVLPAIGFLCLSAHYSIIVHYLDNRRIHLKSWFNNPNKWFPVGEILEKRKIMTEIKRKPLLIEHDKLNAFLNGGK